MSKSPPPPSIGKKRPVSNLRLDDKYQPKSERETLAEVKRGGAYIPPFRMKRMREKIPDRELGPEVVQRLNWEALRKSVNGIVNKVNTSNLKNVILEVFNENLIRGRGLFCRAIMKAQMASPAFTPVYASLVAVINTKIPEIGKLLVFRLIGQFQRGWRRNDKIILKPVVAFIAHLTNQSVVHEVLALEIITLCLRKPTNDSVEVCKELLLLCGMKLMEVSKEVVLSVFDNLRDLLQTRDRLDIRVQYELESLFEAYRRKFADYPTFPDENLDIVDEDDAITHLAELSGNHPANKQLDVFNFDEDYDKHEEEWQSIRREILGEDSDESGGESEWETDTDEEDNGDGEKKTGGDIHDMSETNAMNLRRQIYLTIVSSLSFEEMAHKILKQFRLEDACHVAKMVVECCAHERSYRKQYGLLAERLCKVKNEYEDAFDELFSRQYELVDNLDTNKIRNVARFFAHLLVSEALDWTALGFLRLTKQDTNPSKRIFIKVLFQEMGSWMGRRLRETLQSEEYVGSFEGLFPKGKPSDTRFAINFFTLIGLGALTEGMRSHLKEHENKLLAQQAAARKKEQESDSSDDTDDSSSDSDDDSSDDSDGSSSDEESDDESDEPPRKRRRRSGSTDHQRQKDREEARLRRREERRKERHDEKNMEKQLSRMSRKDGVVSSKTTTSKSSSGQSSPRKSSRRDEDVRREGRGRGLDRREREVAKKAQDERVARPSRRTRQRDDSRERQTSSRKPRASRRRSPSRSRSRTRSRSRSNSRDGRWKSRTSPRRRSYSPERGRWRR